ncbi:hypothetical protein COJ48_18280 [Bacillus cereus]|nr:hypothetical protein COJ48_18280 [Bacillus cereus]PGP74957.1 hypothetical protein CN997_27480 [Bacillus cereus]
MNFSSKVDIFFITFIFLTVFLMSSLPLLPLFIYGGTSLSIIIILTAIFVISVGLIFWYATSIKYVFYEDYLLIKGGPFKSKIPYQNIIEVSPTNERFTGYRISSSDKGFEILLTSGPLRNVKVLPKDKIKFITELNKRCPNALIQELK